MTCPDVDRLISLIEEPGTDLEAVTHLQECPECRESVQLLRMFNTAVSPSIDVPDQLVSSTMQRLTNVDSWSNEIRPRQLMTSAILGTITAGITVLATGSMGNGSPLELLLFSVGMGGIAIAYEIWNARRQTSVTAT